MVSERINLAIPCVIEVLSTVRYGPDEDVKDLRKERIENMNCSH